MSFARSFFDRSSGAILDPLLFPKTEVPLPPRFFFRVFRKARTREKGGAKEKKKGENSPLTFPSLARLLPLPKKKKLKAGSLAGPPPQAQARRQRRRHRLRLELRGETEPKKSEPRDSYRPDVSVRRKNVFSLFSLSLFPPLLSLVEQILCNKSRRSSFCRLFFTVLQFSREKGI